MKDPYYKNIERERETTQRQFKKIELQRKRNSTMANRIQIFRNNIREGLIYKCANCRRVRFSNQVMELTDVIKYKLETVKKTFK